MRAPDDAPQYQLGKVRIEEDRFGKAILVFDYTRTREGKGSVQLAGRTSEGPLRITFAPNVNKPSGEIRLNRSFGGYGGGFDYEFYLVTSANWAGKFYGHCLVSNRVQIGEVDSGPSARRLSDEERAAYEKDKLFHAPPSSAPHGYEIIDLDTPVAMGMRVKAGYYGDWVDAELLALTEGGQATVRFLSNDSIKLIQPGGFLAASLANLSKAASEPSGFRPSLRLMPGSVAPLPKDAEPIPVGVDLPDGAPLLKSNVNGWGTVYVVEDMGGSVKVIDGRSRDFHGRKRNGDFFFAKTAKRETLAIRRDILPLLDDESSVAKWKINLIPKKERRLRAASGSGFGDATGFEDDDPLEDYHVIKRDYSIDAAIPRRAQKLPKDIEAPPGTQVAYCNFFDKWEASTVILDEGRTVVIQENDRHSNRVAYRLPRHQVIIQDKTLRKIKRASAAKVEDLKKTLRTWTDSTGNHKVEARFVAVKEGKVTLKTDSGREISLRLDRLSEEDQELLENAGAASDNPFE